MLLDRASATQSISEFDPWEDNDVLAPPTPVRSPRAGAHRTGAAAAIAEDQVVHVKRISEEMQKDEELMGLLRRVGALPGRTVTIARTDDGILIGSGGESAELVVEAAEHIFVRR